MKYAVIKGVLALAMGLIVLPAHAAMIYDVSSTTRINCSNSPHGLWTSTDMGHPSCDANYFDIDSGTTLTVEDDYTARLVGTATNPDGLMASVDLMLSGHTDDHTDIGSVKNGGGGVPSTWDFFRSIAGTIVIDGTSYLINGFAGATAFQLGEGANDKTGAFGGSAWITSPDMSSHHWDLNLNLTARVPEPGTLGLLGLGLVGLTIARRRSRV